MRSIHLATLLSIRLNKSHKATARPSRRSKRCLELHNTIKYYSIALTRPLSSLLPHRRTTQRKLMLPPRYNGEGWFPLRLDCRRSVKNPLFLYLVLFAEHSQATPGIYTQWKPAFRVSALQAVGLNSVTLSSHAKNIQVAFINCLLGARY